MRYTAIGEVDVSLTAKRAERWIANLPNYLPEVGRTEDGKSEIVILIEDDKFQVAAIEGLIALVEAAGQLRSFTIVTTAEYDRRTDAIDSDTLIGATEAAAMIGVSRQRVQQLAATSVLPSTKVGRSLVFPRDAVHAYAVQTGAANTPALREAIDAYAAYRPID